MRMAYTGFIKQYCKAGGSTTGCETYFCSQNKNTEMMENLMFACVSIKYDQSNHTHAVSMKHYLMVKLCTWLVRKYSFKSDGVWKLTFFKCKISNLIDPSSISAYREVKIVPNRWLTVMFPLAGHVLECWWCDGFLFRVVEESQPRQLWKANLQIWEGLKLPPAQWVQNCHSCCGLDIIQIHLFSFFFFARNQRKHTQKTTFLRVGCFRCG